MIRTKDRKLVPFQQNEVQSKYEQDCKLLSEFIRLREIILKARQMGFSTYIAAKMFLNTVNIPNTQSIIIAQDETNSKKIFQMVRRFYDHLPKNLQMKLGTDSKVELWWPEIDSYFFVGWAGSKKIGRGGTVNNVHFSEPAFYESAEELISGLQQSVPIDGNIFWESTANGLNNLYYFEYQAALEHDSILTPRFYPWFFSNEYRSDRAIQGGATSENFVPDKAEERLIENVLKEFNIELSFEQLIWRRNKILELKSAARTEEKPVGTFPQEYPSNADEAFITTGKSFFDQEHITEVLLPRTSPPLSESDKNVPAHFSSLKALDYELEIWKRPVKGHKYVITADPSEGIPEKGKDHDYCSTDVIDFETGEQVATLHGRWEPHEYAGLLNELGRWYNTGLLIVERNNHGHSVLNSLINSYEYPKMFDLEWGGLYYHQEYDQKSKRKTMKPGFPTNLKTKAMATGYITELVDEDAIKINSRASVRQMRLFSHLPGGKIGGVGGHDDRVSSLWLAAFILRDTMFIKKAEKREQSQKKRKFGKITSAVGASGHLQ